MAKRGGSAKDRAESTRPARVALPERGYAAELQEEILSWYEASGRDLPWRRTRDPYAILVSELMLQQTQAPRVIPKYEAFLAKFPTVQSLAKAPLGEVLRSWSGLGYNRRAQYLHRAARFVADRSAGFPRSADELRALPGVGPYTAGAVAAFAFNEDVIILETNIRRVYQLLFNGDDDSDAANRLIGEAMLPRGRAADWYHALMDLGTAVRGKGGAAAQQEVLRQLFPLLREHTFPTFSGARVERPRQSAFAGSHRFFRGQLLQRLQGGSATGERLFQDLDVTKASAALEELIREGLVIRESSNDLFRLP